MEKQRITWDEGTWTHQPVAVDLKGDTMVVTAQEGSDAWRNTSYGFVHDTEHALVKELPIGAAMEVTFMASFDQQFDQAGIFVRLNEYTWVKAGVEYADGELQLGAVVTHDNSDWSVAPVPGWSDSEVCIRISRHDDCLIIRARKVGEDFALVRVTPFSGSNGVMAGPFTCAPTRAGLQVRFTQWYLTEADKSLH
ncbi:DUF1349 domain-containing protein [Actinomycetaceae bacterium WB03_NA08]|uniref:DUF1349 domain-containing protein n=1 Tax=Scrofimicrobium canadense TaxID=2652290 RepID=A0A6N7W9V5_9ACTO|nr:DUF1349 domain-containing protein [Scrofimicrobium canadense]MSS85026.1 DUF1349 domain-containing protein [Scrofimicrobium canadense]